MDFTCDNCGASLTPEATRCGFCKTVTPPPLPDPPPRAASAASSGGAGGESPLPGLLKLYTEGKVDRALSVLSLLYKQRPECERDAEILLLHAKVLIETEGTIGQMKQVLDKAFVAAPTRPAVLEYREVVEAKEKLDSPNKAMGERILRALLKRSPDNPHALLILGTHQFWENNAVNDAIHYLEHAVKVRPVLLRAWACLGAIYTSIGRAEAAERAFRKCVGLESHPKMAAYFESLATKKR